LCVHTVTLLVVGETARTVAIVQLAFQYGIFLYIELATPSVDRIENHFQGWQFFVEGSSTLCSVLILHGVGDAASLRPLTFLFSVAAVFLPIILSAYDALVPLASQLCRKEEVDWKSVCLAILALATALPGAILSYLGISAGLDDAATGFIEGSADIIDAGVVELVQVEDSAVEVAAELANLASDVAGALHWMTRPMPHHHQAAKMLQKKMQARACGIVARHAVAKLRSLSEEEQRHIILEVRQEMDETHPSEQYKTVHAKDISITSTASDTKSGPSSPEITSSTGSARSLTRSLTRGISSAIMGSPRLVPQKHHERVLADTLKRHTSETSTT